MKMPRDLTRAGLAKKLKQFGYEITRQTGSHLRLTTQQGGEHHVTVPNHNPLRVGTLSGILTEVAMHFGLTKEELTRQLFS